MAKPLDYNATLIERIDVNAALGLFRVRPDALPEAAAWFVPGQYFVLGLNNPEQQDLGSVRRSMSIASAPEDRGAIEFYVRRIAKPGSPNPLTHLLWKLEPGDRLYLRPVAAGMFTVPDTVGLDDPRLRVMVAAGTGLAPFVSMVRSEVRRDPRADLSRWVLLHGASYPTDLGYRDELLRMVETNHLRYWATVSRPQEAPDWNGDTGRVEAFFDGARLGDLEQRLGLPPGGLNPRSAVVFVCGLTGTITGTIVRLIDRGFVPRHNRIRDALGVPAGVEDSLFYEQYDTDPVIDLKDETAVATLRQRMQAALAKLPR